MKFGGFDVDVGWDLAADNHDNLYVTGYYQNFSELDATQLEDELETGNLDSSWHITMLAMNCGIGQRTPMEMVFQYLIR